MLALFSTASAPGDFDKPPVIDPRNANPNKIARMIPIVRPALLFGLAASDPLSTCTVGEFVVGGVSIAVMSAVCAAPQ
jgi:hypothetical protein